jgi:hypothetical protein
MLVHLAVTVTLFSHLIKFYKFSTYSEICKDIAVMNCVAVQHKKLLSPSTFLGYMLCWCSHNRLYCFISHNMSAVSSRI